MLSPAEGQVSHALLSRSPLYSLPEGSFLVRLACLNHAANVRSEPGSNSPLLKYQQQDESCFYLRKNHAVPSALQTHRYLANSLGSREFLVRYSVVKEPCPLAIRRSGRPFLGRLQNLSEYLGVVKTFSEISHKQLKADSLSSSRGNLHCSACLDA